MRILIVSGIFPPDHGGPAGYVPRVARALVERGHELLAVITLSHSLDHDDSIYPYRVLRITRKGGYRIYRRLRTMGLIFRLARQSDVVYINGLPFESIIAAKLLARRPVVIKVVGDLLWETARNRGITSDSIDVFQSRQYGVSWRLLRSVRDILYRRVDRLIVPSCYLQGIVAQWLGNETSHVDIIFNSMDPPDEDSIDITARVDLVTVARMVPWKGIDTLIDVARANGWSLNIIGDGPMRATLEGRAGDALGKSIHFLGHVPHDGIYNELAQCKVFVLNSTYEGLPHIVLEALVTPIAVIATAVGGTCETIRNGVDGYLIPPNDAEQLSSHIRKLLDNPELRQRFCAAGRERVMAEFAFGDMVDATERTLREAIKKGKT